MRRSKDRSGKGTGVILQTMDGINLARQWQAGLPILVGAVSVTQRQAGEILELMGRSTRAKVGLMHQAVWAAQDPDPLGSQAKWLGFWMSALGLAQSNTAAVLGIHGRALNSWLRLVGSTGGAGNGKG